MEIDDEVDDGLWTPMKRPNLKHSGNTSTGSEIETQYLKTAVTFADS